MGLRDVLLERLAAAGLAEAVGRWVLDAFDAGTPPGWSEDSEASGGRAFLKSITVSGFRGIGAKTSLGFTPGPGLTLVVGRNGSGKSSFAEGAEIALTATNARWQGLSVVWKDGWRNLHVDEPPSVTLSVQVDGEDGGTTIRRSWTGPKVEDSACEVFRPGRGACELEDLGWSEALATHRPFLSYSELGKMLTSGPKGIHDSIAGILGLERLTLAESRLNDVRKELEGEAKAVKAEKDALCDVLGEVEDPRAASALALLTARTPDFGAVEALAVVGPGSDPDLAELRKLAALRGPSVGDAAAALRQAAERVASLRGGTADDARRLADLLALALDRQDGDARCPVCATEDVLDAALDGTDRRRDRPAAFARR
ncbi:AAA family ATPase [Actinomadura rupiterrae]|uniref:AAA family ATPase n=1 Tax=Actinomadura rupiterrae TaxID=559627 RepID=UPI0020A5B347|nr:AAA family ATPase [Actinomadura rupiterrae]MCP2339534.1 hypothetical protein [Actinomadura rupiterrae]